MMVLMVIAALFALLAIGMPVGFAMGVSGALGLLIPQVDVSSLRGFSWEQPYLQVISPSEDIVLSPQINTKVNPFLNAEWRKRFYSGAIDIRAGYTYEQDFDSSGDKLGNPTSRTYVLGKGLFQIDPTSNCVNPITNWHDLIPSM